MSSSGSRTATGSTSRPKRSDRAPVAPAGGGFLVATWHVITMSARPDWVTLAEGESVLWESRPAIHPYLFGATKALSVSAAGVGLWLVSAGVIEVGAPVPSGTVIVTLAGALVVLGVALAGNALLKWSSVRYLVTTEEVYAKEGLLSRTVTNLRVGRIQNTAFSQSVVGRVLSYGDVRIHTAGSGDAEMVFEYAPDPETVVARITERVDDRIEGSAPSARG